MANLAWIAHCILCLVTLSHAALFSNLWAVHIEGGERKARSIAENTGFTYLGKIMGDLYHFRHHQVARRSTAVSERHHTRLESEPEVRWLAQQEIRVRVKRDAMTFNDREFRHQWYLWDRGARSGSISMNVQAAWRLGYTGRGVVVTILDDGIERVHPDLSANYDQQASWDINSGDSDPTPRYDFTNENRHGTRCAGEVAAAANNSNCGVGVAYEARIGGIRMLDGDVTDSVEAMSLSLNRDHIDIYSASWGPDDDGKTVDGPALLARRAFREGVQQGRGGKGSIFVWASGNGGRDSDNCNCDGYTNSIYTLSVSSATENGNVPWYSEACSSTLVSTFSSGDHKERQITTTDLRRGCTGTHTGTSASAPLAAGIVALALHANPKLTWRDVQYISVLAASSNGLEAPDWVTNGAGRKVSHHFGFGMMDAARMVQLAANWTSLPEQHVCEVVSQRRDVVIMREQTVRVVVPTLGCKGSDRHVKYVEHVQAKISLTSSRRGDVRIWLTSPSGTRSTLLTRRVNDNSLMGFNEWAFLTTHNWGEEAEGEWILEISNGYRAAKPAVLRYWTLILYGTATSPLEPTGLNAAPTPESVKNSYPKAAIVQPGTDRLEEPAAVSLTMPSAAVLSSNWTTPRAVLHHTSARTTANNGQDKSDHLRPNSASAPQSGIGPDHQITQCPNNTFYVKNSCRTKCPNGYYGDAVPNRGLICQSCHSSCATCVRAHNSSCTECFYGFQLIGGRCIPTTDVANYKTGASAKSYKLSPAALKSVIFGATSTLVVLVLILISLVVYYVYHQYESQRKPQHTRSRTQRDAAYSPAACEQLNGSKHSSQQELMDSDEEASSQGKTSLMSTPDYRYQPGAYHGQSV